MWFTGMCQAEVWNWFLMVALVDITCSPWLIWMTERNPVMAVNENVLMPVDQARPSRGIPSAWRSGTP
ncbi:hypothetical protein [Allosediminivita pacifica]|uniref:Uncharacterized protein n=1 Tax=Allosediminivita pacifica TaxID=1267769 RepID=A0A2T6ASV4_9RHOB|nr:hypothetical protein [Allosediminivita pacifica]PTX46893.1 hypothetical protein C8N44_11435 [Allosediminivita pacifica]GGB15423.1 hypothetical protein GCM10011324_27020 [Allosediminivita pacifica]